MIPIQTIINDVLVKKQEEKEKDYTQKTWHASSLGSCMRGNYLKRLGIAPDEPITPTTLRKFAAGNIFEEWVVNLVKQQPNTTIETQVRVESELYNLSGKIDILLTEYIDGFINKEVVELKSQHSRSFWWNIKNGNKPQRHHEYQIWVYLKTLGIEEGRIVYISKDDLSIQEYEVKLQDFDLANEVIAYLEAMNKAWKEKNPLLLSLPEENSWQEKFCQYHQKCVNEEFLKTLHDENKSEKTV